MHKTTLTTAVIAGIAGVAGLSEIASMPSGGIDPYYRIDDFSRRSPYASTSRRHYTPKFKPMLRKARNKRAKQSRARNRQ